MARARKVERAANRSGWLLDLDVGMVPALALGLISAMGCRTAAREAGGPGASARPGRAATAHAPASAPRPRIASYLQDDYERIFPERVRLAHYGAVRYAARDTGDAGGDGERSDAIDMGDAMTMVVVDKVRDRVRVIAPQDHYRLLLWVDERDLYTVVTEVAPLSPDTQGAPGKPASSAAGIRLHPGMAVEVDGESRGMAHIRHRDDCVSFSGLLPRTALGNLFVPIETGEREVDSAVAAGTAVFDRPGGRQVARFLSECDVAATGPERDGFRPILYASEWFELRGWVPTGSGKASSGNGNGSSWGYGYGHLGLWGSRSRFRVPEGTCLFARRGGPAVGLVTDEADAPLSAPVNGWWQLPLETVWGDLTVWVAQDRSRPPEEKKRETRPRPALRAYDVDPNSADSGDTERATDDESDLPALRRCR